MLALGAVRRVGYPVAGVVTTGRYTARDAADLMEATWKPPSPQTPVGGGTGGSRSLVVGGAVATASEG